MYQEPPRGFGFGRGPFHIVSWNDRTTLSARPRTVEKIGANHAGTTPMNRRRDALATAAKNLLAVRDVVGAETGTQVGTVGYLRAEPGAPNAIPGLVEFTVELRDLGAGKIDRMWQHIQQKFAQTDKRVSKLVAK